MGKAAVAMEGEGLVAEARAAEGWAAAAPVIGG